MEFYGVLYTNCHFIEGKYFLLTLFCCLLLLSEIII